MERTGNLWPRIVSWDNLLESAYAAAAGKRKRPDVARFFADLEPNLCALQRELEAGAYQPGPYRTFWIFDPKPRQISAAPFRDRVVHHALVRTIEPVFERRFTQFSFASRAGFGQHRALELAKIACLRYPYVLKADIRKYFPSLDHRILGDLLGRVVKCGPTLDLARRIIAGSNEQEEAAAYFPGDDLFSPWERRRGLPIGNQTSQFFANVYLNPLDHFVLRELRPALYLRYVDDFVLFGEDKAELTGMRAGIADFLAGLRLRVHDGKSRIYRTKDGFPLLGWRLFPGYTRLPGPKAAAARHRLEAVSALYHDGRIGLAGVKCRVHAWLGHAAHGDTWRLRRRLFRTLILVGAERDRRCFAGRVLEQQSRERSRLEP